ncbi:hypothetical protein OSB04_021245 [Centaurea solstitialis]|uniref:Prolamin-like domain-containing protein n=1 Tax=Centaurea solstitialis TaxID=347529 RepID=A0AA38W6L6_9ASTR|nr:hypothetical protein OSB04_021245 [Centaurea solstitialis]
MASLKSFLAISLFATLLVFLPSGLAQDLTPGFGFGPPPSTSLPTLEQCWLSIEEIVGCYNEVFRAFQSGKIGMTIGPACCLAINDITSDCWLKMFPNAPTFPFLLNNYCKNSQVAPTSSDQPDLVIDRGERKLRVCIRGEHRNRVSAFGTGTGTGIYQVEQEISEIVEDLKVSSKSQKSAYKKASESRSRACTCDSRQSSQGASEGQQRQGKRVSRARLRVTAHFLAREGAWIDISSASAGILARGKASGARTACTSDLSARESCFERVCFSVSEYLTLLQVFQGQLFGEFFNNFRFKHLLIKRFVQFIMTTREALQLDNPASDSDSEEMKQTMIKMVSTFSELNDSYNQQVVLNKKLKRETKSFENQRKLFEGQIAELLPKIDELNTTLFLSQGEKAELLIKVTDLEDSLAKERSLITSLKKDLQNEHDQMLKHSFGNAQNLKLVTSLRKENDCLQKKFLELNEDKMVFENKFISSQSKVTALSKQLTEFEQIVIIERSNFEKEKKFFEEERKVFENERKSFELNSVKLSQKISELERKIVLDRKESERQLKVINSKKKSLKKPSLRVGKYQNLMHDFEEEGHVVHSDRKFDDKKSIELQKQIVDLQNQLSDERSNFKRKEKVLHHEKTVLEQILAEPKKHSLVEKDFENQKEAFKAEINKLTRKLSGLSTDLMNEQRLRSDQHKKFNDLLEERNKLSSKVKALEEIISKPHGSIHTYVPTHGNIKSSGQIRPTNLFYDSRVDYSGVWLLNKSVQDPSINVLYERYYIEVSMINPEPEDLPKKHIPMLDLVCEGVHEILKQGRHPLRSPNFIFYALESIDYQSASQVESIFEPNDYDDISLTLARVFVIPIAYLCDIAGTV